MLGAWFYSYYHTPTPELLQIYIATGDIPAFQELKKSGAHREATNFKFNIFKPIHIFLKCLLSVLILGAWLDYYLMKIISLRVFIAHYVFLFFFFSFQSAWKIPLSQLHTVSLNNVLFLAHHCFPLCLFQKVKLNRRVDINPHDEL